MKRISPEDLESYSKHSLIELADHLMDEVDYSLMLIRNLEKQLEKALEELGGQSPIVQELKEQIDGLKRRVFGRSSERAANLPDIFEDLGNRPSPSDESKDSGKPKDKGSNKPKRKKAEAKLSENAPIEDIFHYASDEQVARLDLKVWQDKYEVSELITIVPTAVKLERHHRQKYTYMNAEGERRFYTADGVLKLREGAQYSIEFVAHIAAGKYAFHLPLDRQTKMLAEKGLDIPTSSLQNQVDYAAFLLRKSLFQPILERLQKGKIVEADDTTWPNLESLKTRKQDKYYLWGMKDEKAVAFNIFNARSQKVAKDFLGKQEGILITDGHNSFDVLVSKNLILAAGRVDGGVASPHPSQIRTCAINASGSSF